MAPDDCSPVARKRRHASVLTTGLSTIITASCSLFSTDDRYTVQGAVQTCHHLDGVLVRCFNEPSASKTIVLDGRGGGLSTDYSSGSFRFYDVLEGGYEVSLSYPPEYLDSIAADSIWAPARWIFVPPLLLDPKEVMLDEWVYYCEETCK